MKHHPINLSVIIPAYNEENRIGRALETITAYLNKQPYRSEIIVVDDGSHDQTGSVAARTKGVRCIRLDKNSGKGFAVRTGVLAAQGSHILFSDADLSTPIEEVEKCLYHLQKGADVVLGSRSLKDSHIIIHQPWHRELMGKIYNRVVRLLVFRGISDTQCGFKCFKAEAAQKIFKQARIDRFSFDVEILYLAKKFGCKIQQIPVRWSNDPTSSVRPLTDAYQTFLDLLKIKYLHRNR